MAASYVVQLPAMIQTTSAVDPSTGAVPFWDVSDAQAITITCVSVTSIPSPRVQVALTTDAAANWVTLSYFTSGASAVVTSSSIALTIPVTAYKLVRVTSSAVLTAAMTHNANKLIIV